MSMVKALSLATAVMMTLPLAACTTAQSSRICVAAGGSYANGTCERAGQQEAEKWCATRGGVYLAGQDSCVLGSGGP